MFFYGLIESIIVTGTAKTLQEGYREPALLREFGQDF
jgi:hypothetical protein